MPQRRTGQPLDKRVGHARRQRPQVQHVGPFLRVGAELAGSHVLIEPRQHVVDLRYGRRERLANDGKGVVRRSDHAGRNVIGQIDVTMHKDAIGRVHMRDDAGDAAQHCRFLGPPRIRKTATYGGKARAKMENQVGPGTFRDVHEYQPALFRESAQEQRYELGLEVIAQQQPVQVVAGVIRVTTQGLASRCRIIAENAVMHLFRARTIERDPA